jgi:hypothetical protein
MKTLSMKKYTEVRVLDSTHSPTKKTIAMIGGEFEVRSIFCHDGDLSVYNADKDDCFFFTLSDVRFLTPLSYKGKRIAIGDEIKWYNSWHTVCDYVWYNGKWDLLLVRDNDFDKKCYLVQETQIASHRTNSENDEVKKAIEVLEKAGKLKDGRILV